MTIAQLRKSNGASAPTRTQRPHRGLGLAGLAIALVLPGALAVGNDVHAAEGLAHALVDCARAGDQFVLDDFDDSTTTAEAVDESGKAVLALTVADVITRVERNRFSVVTVPPDTDYSAVRFTNVLLGVTQIVAPVEEDCTPTPFNAAIASPGQGLVPVNPQRLLDTRTLLTPNGTSTSIAGGVTVEVAVLGQGAIPRNAGAVMLNVGAVQPQSVGHLRVFPCGTPLPKTSSLNYVAGETRAADVFVKPGAGGKVCIYTAARTDLIADVQGYVPSGSQPFAIAPVRVADTRVGAPVDGPGLLPRKKVNEYAVFRVSQVAAAAGLPADTESLVINITATNATAAGYVAVNGCADVSPTGRGFASTLNFTPGRAVANLSITETNLDKVYESLSPSDELCVYVSRPVDLIVDITGYSTSLYAAPVAVAGGFRALETRPNVGEDTGTPDGAFSNYGRLEAGAEYKIRIGGREVGGYAEWRIPQQTAVLLNVTAIRPAANGHVTVYECGKRPGTSNLNARKDQTVANAAYVQLDRNGDVCVYSSVSTDLVLDATAFGARLDPPTLFWDQIELDTYRQRRDMAIVGGTPPYQVSATLPASVSISVDDNGVISYTGDPDTYMYYLATITVIDAEGKKATLDVDIVRLPPGALIPTVLPRT